MTTDLLAFPDYRALEAALLSADAVMSPSEVHGMLIGRLIRLGSLDIADFVQGIIGTAVRGDPSRAEALELIERLYRVSSMQLWDSGCELRLLLPEDNQALEARVDAVCGWARGLIYGLAEQGVAVRDALDRDSRDFLADCRTISNTEFAIEETEEDEQIFLELVEYLRIGALMLQEDFQPQRASQRPQ